MSLTATCVNKSLGVYSEATTHPERITKMDNTNYAKMNQVPTVGANDYQCPHCKALGRVMLSYEEVAHIRAYGGGKSVAHCVKGHTFDVIWHTWYPLDRGDNNGTNA